MADKVNPNQTSSYNFLPRFYRSDANKKFTQATIDQLVQPGTVKKINGYIGRQNSKATTGADLFIKAASDERQNYQLEPGLTVKDSLDNVTFFKDYQDYINQLGVFGSNTGNHAILNSQEFYSWNPHIDWDKFVNFQNYYWLPNGPDVIKIAGQQQAIQSTYTVALESEFNTYEYVFTPNGISRNPTLRLFRGQTYTFEINSPGQPFSIKTRRSSGNLDRYRTFDFTQAAVESGTLTITIPFDAPDVLYYVSEANVDVGGVFQVLSIDENSFIDVEAEIVGKKTYVLPSGESLTNGMLVTFLGNVNPEKYATGQFYVEGVGDSITLTNKRDLELISSYTLTESVLFDSTSFDTLPFSDATSLATSIDYHVINRSSLDKNPWSRYNRWFHKDVVETTARINGNIASLDQNNRAIRPILEFNAGLKLFNFGTHAVVDVNLVDNFTTDVFSTIEGSLGYNIDGIAVAQGQRILFTADTDSLVQNKIFRVEFLDVLHDNSGSRQIHLVLENEPIEGQSVLVKDGKINKGLSYWYNGSVWKLSQQKYTTNQPPLFDIVDDTGTSLGDITVYDGSTFKGTALFSYKQGTGTADASLGFALSYKNINNVGDIIFNFNILTDTFQYKKLTTVFKSNIDTGYLTSISPATDIVTYTNGWQKSVVKNVQAGLRIYKNSNKTNNFDIDIFDDVTALDDLQVKVYVNGLRLDPLMWSVVSNVSYKTVVLTTDIALTDVLTIKAYARQPINSIGHYELPINLQNNPLNGSMADFTLGEVIDHVGSIVDNLSTFSGSFPGASNLRDLGDVSAYGTKFVQHSGPMSLSMYHITSESSNVIKAIEQSRDEYNSFKRTFITTIDNLGVDYLDDTVAHVNAILKKINKDKPVTGPYYFSDMIGCSAYITNTYNVIDYRIKTYPVTTVFSLAELSSRAVYVYHNETQLIYGKDYEFSDQGFVIIKSTINNDDTITVHEYDSTDGCFIPSTPTKLGIWPKYEPKIYTDTTLNTAGNPPGRQMIQGHDGSQILAYGDYRDDLILELEKRIFNNIKVEYNAEIFDINDLTPSYIHPTDFSLSEFNEILSPQFYKWTSLVDRDFTKPLSFDKTNPLSFNYKQYAGPDGRMLPGYWRGIYRWVYDTDRPNLCPWEMLGIALEPQWWQDVYGPAPYTSDNLVMWQDISLGLVKEPGKPPVELKKYIRPFLMDYIPVDEVGQIVDPITTGFVQPPITQSIRNDFIFGDVSPVEAAWRRSSHYPFSFLITVLLLKPAHVFGVLLDRSRVIRNLTGQLVYKDTGLRITPSSIVLPSTYTSTTRVQTSGLVNYIVDYILKDNLKSYASYVYDLKNIFAQLSYRLGGFTSKQKFNLLLDSRTPTAVGSVFVPPEDYSIILNTSSPVRKVVYSGVIITKLAAGYEVKGYSKLQPFFKYYPWIQPGANINVGGISESFSEWTSSSRYTAGKIVRYASKFYRVKVSHTSTADFDLQYYSGLPYLPITGGANVTGRIMWDRTEAITVPYGTIFRSSQEVYDFLVGYGEWLKDQGFIFDDFNNNLNAITNWETSAKEFLFWTTQKWSTTQDKWKEWNPNDTIEYQDIVRYNGEYFQAIITVAPSDIFNEDNFTKLEGLSTVGSSVISLSPSASKLTFSTDLCVVEDIRSAFNGYEIYKVDGSPIADSFIDSYREDNAVSYTPRGNDGIFGATFYLIQKEQVVLLNNTTIFGDTIYNQESGYRQERIKVAGYVTIGWNGAFAAPGFIFDQAKVVNWQPWTDYALGEVVKYKEFYYSAAQSLTGTLDFDHNSWFKLANEPEPELLPNWTYKAAQFEDFYSLDSDNFDAGQQKMAQHLVGYQKRQYLENIIQDDVSEFKFYQGMITEKGTQNSLNKLFDVLSAEGQESLKFYEEWAVRVGMYGASSAFENIEFTLDESSFKNNPQGIELVQTIDPANIDFIIRQTPTDIYLKPLGYNNNPWPLVANYTPYLRSAGFVRADEVKVILKSLEDILNENVDNYNNGDYIWVGFEGREWNIYRYTEYQSPIVNATYTSSSKTLTIETDTIVSLPVDSYIGVETGSFKGFYKISSVDGNKMIISATVTTWQPFVTGEYIRIFALTSQLAESIDNADTTITTERLEGELLWTKDSGDGKWATWKYASVYAQTEVLNTLPADGALFGKNVSVNQDGNVTLVADTSGQMGLYTKPVPGVPWTKRQIIPVPLISGVAPNPNLPEWSNEISAFSSTGAWLAIGSPRAGSASTSYRGSYNGAITYAIGDLVRDTGKIYKALVSTNTQPSTHPLAWKEASLIETSLDGTDVGPTGQGVVTLYYKNSIGLYSLISTFTSPTPTQDENFGSTLAFGDNVLFITAADDTGRVYQLDYDTRTKATAFYNPVGSSGTTIKVDSTVGIEPGMNISGIGFTKNQEVVQVVNATTLRLLDAPDGDPFGKLQFTVTGWAYHDTTGTNESVSSGALYGESLAVSKDSSTLVVSAPGSTQVGQVFVYKKNTLGTYALSQTLTGTDIKFGNSVTISDSATYLGVSSILSDGQLIDQGEVLVYKLNGTQYTNPVSITNLKPEQSELFGTKISFMNDSKTLVVYSASADTRESWVLEDNTTFDDSTTTFYLAKNIDAGRIDIYDKYANTWIFGESLVTPTSSSDGYGYSISVGANTIFVSAPYALDNSLVSGRVFTYSKKADTYNWNILHKETSKVDLTKIKSAFLYNKKTNELITYLDVVDPAQGKIPGIAEQEIKFKTYYDPAVYSTGDTTVTVDDGVAWKKSQVGMLWWDLRTAKFIDSAVTDDPVYRNSTWNTLFPYASIDIYEWVETKLLPAEWNKLADTENGLAQGVSGTTLYGNTIYSIVKKYDTVGKVFKNTYYYWVKNKKTTPNIPERHMSAQDVSSLIGNTRGQGYKYLALTSSNSFSLVNVKNDLQDTDVVLSVEYWTADHKNQNIHSQWKIISDNIDTTLPAPIEQKWIDSLCGKDSAGRLVPDPALAPKIKYGIENRPRQGMFINRFEALKQYFERVNLILIDQQISGQRDFSKLESYEQEPSLNSGLYDSVLDTDAELRFAGVGSFTAPSVTPIITNGSITGINIISAGRGFVVAPYIQVNGSGVGAKVRAIINIKGQLTGAEIINPGYGYTDSTTLSIRNYSVLVHSDSQALNSWSIYSYNPSSKVWARARSQSYDTRNYWSYADWYSSGYSVYSVVDYSVETFSDLNALKVSIGQTVKIRTTSSGTWFILEKYSNSTSIDWTQSYTVVAQQNGTIQFSSSLYSFSNTTYGFDGELFDGSIFDNSASTELRIILQTLKDNILVDTLKQTYLDLFFSSVRYAMSEQTYLDWIFKTSFVKAQHNVGSLRQPSNYKNDNLSDFESYIAEVKPYRTQIREYISNYTKVEPADMSISDFDLQPAYENGAITVVNANVVDEKLVYGDANLETYPWKNWLDNASYKITNIEIIDNGANYHMEPVVRFVSNSGSGARARAFISNGRVNRIVLLDPGSGYLSAPTILIEGGLNQGGTSARAVAIIGDGVTRSQLIKMKFDRITRTYFITQLEETETFIGTGSRLQFALKWSPDIRVGKSSVTVNGVDVLRDDYTLSKTKSTVKGYTSYNGTLVLKTAPATGAVISVTYLKDWALLNAADRIQYYYNPETGQLGKDLAQLMTGVDYGGVIVDGLGFNVSQGWDSVPYFSERWDSVDPTFDDFITTTGAGDTQWQLQYVPALGEEINIYHIPLNGTAIRLDDPAYGTVDANPLSIMIPIVSTGISSTIDANTYDIEIPGTYVVAAGDTIIIRRSTSDGSIKPQEKDYDTALSGGDMAYSSATGLRAEDILVDGDGFVTTTSSPATEEVVPGQVFDAVALKVFDKQYSASAKIDVESHRADGSTLRFALNQIPNSSQAVIVKIVDIDSSVLQTAGVDYTVDYQAQEIVFENPPYANTIVTIFSFGFSGANILDIDYFEGNGDTLEFVTRAPWVKSLTSAVYINGVPAISELFKTDNTYDSPNRVGIRFGAAPASGDLVTFVIVAGAEQTFALTKTETIVADGRQNYGPLPDNLPLGTSTYDLVNQVGSALPAEANMIVRVDQQILKGPTNSYYEIKSNRLTYAVDPNRFAPYSLDVADIFVFVDGNILTLGTDFTVDLSGISVKITRAVYNLYKGKTLVVNIKQGQEYIYIPGSDSVAPRIIFSDVYTSANTIEVTSSYNHNILDIQRTNITVNSSLNVTPDTLEYYAHAGITGGTIVLDRTVVSDSYVWITKNGLLLVPNIDYILTEDKQVVKLTEHAAEADEFQVITYGSNVLRAGIAYMQFKDMLNRDHFKRLSLNKQTQLVQPLKYNDVTITVQDASNFDIPNPAKNKPGIIEIRGERIEYFTINYDNAGEVWVLGQLRRATLGTGAPMVHPITSYVQDIGPSETIPYNNKVVAEQVVSDGTTSVPLTFVPGAFNNTWTYKGSTMSTTDITGIAKDAVEVFVGGYPVDSEWAQGVDYTVGTIVTVGSYTYRCTANHTSSTVFLNDSDNWQFFIGNIRLRKDSYSVYNSNIAPDSPEGDVDFDAEFIVDGTSAVINLTTPLVAGTQVTVVRRSGASWDSTVNLLDDNNSVAEFLKATPGIWYVNNNKYENGQQGGSTFDSGAGTLDSINTTFDRG